MERKNIYLTTNCREWNDWTDKKHILYTDRNFNCD